MRAANILVTKAGPGTISEALNAGLPMILYSRLPGQEDGNVDYVISEGVGVWAPKTSYIVSALHAWINHPKQLELAADACCQAARPEAAREIARLLANRLGIQN
jgi:1,2-diacylglycerol 3-beta-galactosyltransferase